MSCGHIQKRQEGSLTLKVSNQVIQDLKQSEIYKYLGMEEGERLQHLKIKGKIWKEGKRRIKLVLKSELNVENKIAAIKTLAAPVIVYNCESYTGKLMRYKTRTG